MRSKVFGPCLVGVLSFVVYFAATEHLFPTAGWPSGDEPYYLLIAHSLVHDHDFELSNNFANKDYLAFYPGDLFPRHESVTTRPLLVSKHSLGLPVLIAPAYAVAGWQGAAHTLNLFGALLAVNIFLLVRETVRSERLAWLVCAALALAPPLFTYAELIFPEVPAALLILYAYRHLQAWHSSNRAQRWLVTLCLAFLPWLHPRFLFIALGLGTYLAFNLWTTHRDSLRRAAGFPPATLPRLEALSRRPAASLRERFSALPAAAALAIPIGISAALYLGYNLYVYDSLLPSYADHSGSGTPAEIVGAFFGIWLDQQWGLLNHAPVYLLAFAALLISAQHAGASMEASARAFTSWGWMGRLQAAGARIWFIIHGLSWQWPLLITLPYFLLVVQYRYWWGEWCPPARYLTPILPLLAAPLAMAILQFRTFRFRLAFTALALLGWGVALAFAWDARLMYNHPLGKSALLGMLSRSAGLDLTALEPSYIMMFLKDIDPAMWIAAQTLLTLGWILALCMLGFWAFDYQPRVLRKRLTLAHKLPIIRPRSPQEE